MINTTPKTKRRLNIKTLLINIYLAASIILIIWAALSFIEVLFVNTTTLRGNVSDINFFNLALSIFK